MFKQNTQDNRLHENQNLADLKKNFIMEEESFL